LNSSSLSKESGANWRFQPTGSTETGKQPESLEYRAQHNWFHLREPLENIGVRLNRDTLYSLGVFDLDRAAVRRRAQGRVRARPSCPKTLLVSPAAPALGRLHVSRTGPPFAIFAGPRAFAWHHPAYLGDGSCLSGLVGVIDFDGSGPLLSEDAGPPGLVAGTFP
jgi:hypothetical protein